MDDALWSSVRELLVELGADPGVFRIAQTAPADRAEPTSLLDYGAYFDLALTLPGEAELPPEARSEAIRHLQRRLSIADAPAAPANAPRITNFSTEHYSADQLARMRRWWDIEPANRMGLTYATDEEFARSCRLIDTAMSQLRDAAPELHGEVETIVRDIILTRPDGTNLINYGGASSFALWGALAVNVETHLEWVQFYRLIVHEAAHNLLFGISRDQPLVLDDPTHRLPSPIRADPRPIDGIFHAAFVSAREALAIEALLRRQDAVGCFSEDDVRVFWDLLELSAFAFWDSVETLRGGGARLTEHGDRILADCEAYMHANFAVEPC